MSTWQPMSLSDSISKREPRIERISSSLCWLLVAKTKGVVTAPPPCPSPIGRGVVCDDWLGFRLFFTFTFIWSNPSPYTPITLLCDTKARGSIILIRRKISTDSFFFANKQITFISVPVYQPCPSRMVRVWSVFLVMARAILSCSREKIINCTDSRREFIT